MGWICTEKALHFLTSMVLNQILLFDRPKTVDIISQNPIYLIVHTSFASSQAPAWEFGVESSSFPYREAGASSSWFPSWSLGTSVGFI
ncbi:MAG: hypothetical protein Q7U66_05395 [Methylobacter sp.]|nr:hypothetical protein [Methylobacter sp.]